MEDGMRNSEGSPKIQAFTDLHTWQEGHRLVIAIYREAASFPKEEQYSLASQIRRSAVSVTSNVAEGFGRWSVKDKIHFYGIARASLIELYNQLLISRDVGLIPVERFNALEQTVHSVHRLINALISKSKETSD